MSLDRELFTLLNIRWHTALLDVVMPWLTNAHKSVGFWLVVLPLVFLLWRSDRRRAKTVLLLLAVLLPCVNGFSTLIVKPLFNRPRPTAQLIVNGKSETVVAGARLPNHGQSLGSSSFPSSHSSTMAACATVLIWAYRRRTRWAWLALLLPLVIGYSRIYVGVHYPSDVLGGWLLGFALGTLACLLTTRLLAKRRAQPGDIAPA